MASPSVVDGSHAPPPVHNATMADDIAVDQTSLKSSSKPKERQFEEIALRFKIRGPAATCKPMTLVTAHLQVLQQILFTCHKDVQILDNHNNRITQINVADWISSLQHECHFVISTARSGEKCPVTHRLCHRILTKLPLREIRSHPHVQSILDLNDMCMKRHTWNESVIDTATLACCIATATKHAPVDDAAKKFLGDLGEFKTKMPKFRLAPTSIRADNNKLATPIRTTTFAIEVQNDECRTAGRVLLHASNKLPTHVVMAKTRHLSPLAFYNAVKTQARRNENTCIVPLLHTSPDVMFYFEQNVGALKGVQDICASNSADGRCNILINRVAFKTARAAISTCVMNLIPDLPEESYPTPPFPDHPQVSGVFDKPSETSKSIVSASIRSLESPTFLDVSPLTDTHAPSAHHHPPSQSHPGRGHAGRGFPGRGPARGSPVPPQIFTPLSSQSPSKLGHTGHPGMPSPQLSHAQAAQSTSSSSLASAQMAEVQQTLSQMQHKNDQAQPNSANSIPRMWKL